MSFLYVNIFYGAVWGILEATLGYLIHLTNMSSTIILCPLAFFFMNQAYKSTEKISSIFFISIISASIKLLDLFTNIRIDKVINPAISILLEGAVFSIMIYIFQKNELKKGTKIISVFVMNTLWRMAYCVYLFFSPRFIYEYSILISTQKIFDFLIIKNIETSIVLITLFWIEYKIKLPILKKVNPAIAIILFIIYII